MIEPPVIDDYLRNELKNADQDDKIQCYIVGCGKIMFKQAWYFHALKYHYFGYNCEFNGCNKCYQKPGPLKKHLRTDHSCTDATLWDSNKIFGWQDSRTFVGDPKLDEIRISYVRPHVELKGSESNKIESGRGYGHAIRMPEQNPVQNFQHPKHLKRPVPSESLTGRETPRTTIRSEEPPSDSTLQSYEVSKAPYICTLCTVSFDEIVDRELHRVEAHQAGFQCRCEVSGIEGRGKKYCDLSFTLFGALAEHMRASHIENEHGIWTICDTKCHTADDHGKITFTLKNMRIREQMTLGVTGRKEDSVLHSRLQKLLRAEARRLQEREAGYKYNCLNAKQFDASPQGSSSRSFCREVCDTLTALDEHLKHVKHTRSQLTLDNYAMYKHESRSLFVCDLCARPLYGQAHNEGHLVKDHNYVYKCTVAGCPEYTSTRTMFVSHISDDHGFKTYFGETFPYAWYAMVPRTSLKVEGEGKPHAPVKGCEERKSFSDDKVYDLHHTNVHSHLYRCRVANDADHKCNTLCKAMEELKRHRQDCHTHELNNSCHQFDTIQATKFICECHNKVYTSLEEYNRHVRYHYLRGTLDKGVFVCNMTLKDGHTCEHPFNDKEKVEEHQRVEMVDHAYPAHQVEPRYYIVSIEEFSRIMSTDQCIEFYNP